MCSFIGNAQVYTVTYKRYVNTSHNNSEEPIKELDEGFFLKNSIASFLTLSYNNGTSLFRASTEAEVVIDEVNSNEYKMSTNRIAESNYYKNQKKQELIVYHPNMFPSFYGKDVIVHSSLPKNDWKLSDQSQKIAGYSCKLATKIKDNGQKIVAWYADQIPINDGPAEYWGLPGLILQLQISDRVLHVVTSIKKESKAIDILKPTGGEVMTNEQFKKFKQEMLKPRTITTSDGRVITISGSNN